MKSFVGWLLVFIAFWGVGGIMYAFAAWRKNSIAQKIATGLLAIPPVFFAIDTVKDIWIGHSYRAAVEEVRELCAKDGGDKIYKTVDNVQGVLQMRLRQPESYRDEKGVYHQWMSEQYGMEDPYGLAQNDRGSLEEWVGQSSIRPDSPPRGKQGYWFIEQRISITGGSYLRNYLTPKMGSGGWLITDNGHQVFEVKNKSVDNLKSKYGYLTEDLTTKEMRDKWIGAGRIKIIDLQTNEVLAERKGYFRASGDMLPSYGDRWHASGGGDEGRICPEGGIWRFLHSTLKPPQDFPTNEQLEALAKD